MEEGRKQLLTALGCTAAAAVMSRFRWSLPLCMIPPMIASGFLPKNRRVLPTLVSGILALAWIVLQDRAAIAAGGGEALLALGRTPLLVGLWVSACVWIGADGMSHRKRFVVGILPGCAAALAEGILLAGEGSLVADAVAIAAQRYAETLDVLGKVLGTLTGEELDAVRMTRILFLTRALMALPAFMVYAAAQTFIAESILLRQDRIFTDKVASWHLPEQAVWFFLAAWFAALITLWLPSRGVGVPLQVGIVTLDLAGAATVLYGMQGFAIWVWKRRERNPEASAVRLFWAVLFISLIIQLVLLVLSLVLPIVGVTETWIRYRTRTHN